MKRVVQLICALVVAGWLLPSAAWGLGGKLPSGPDYELRVLVVTSSVIGTNTVCTADSELYNVVIVSTGPAIRTTLAVAVGTDLQPGDRFQIDSPAVCSPTHDAVLLSPK